MKCLSLFSSGGLAETYFDQIGINVVLANELIPERCKFYKHLYPQTEVIEGDIVNEKIRSKIIDKAKFYGVDCIIATPPCQGMSRHGKRDPYDPRNQMIFYAIDVIKQVRPKFVLIENVPRQLQTKICFNNKYILIPDYIKTELDQLYEIYDNTIFNSANYGVPQSRKRSIFRMVSKLSNKKWRRPSEDNNVVTLLDAIGHLPSLDPLVREEDKRHHFPNYNKKKEAGIKISKWHYPPTHGWNHVLWMMHTPSGKTAFENKIYFPQKKNGTLIKGRISTYKRFSWNKPSNTITQNNGVISSAICVHPGRLLNKNKNEEFRLYSDPRVLTIYELIIISSLPKNIDFPGWSNERLIRHIIGEGIPPLLTRRIMEEIIN